MLPQVRGIRESTPTAPGAHAPRARPGEGVFGFANPEGRATLIAVRRVVGALAAAWLASCRCGDDSDADAPVAVPDVSDVEASPVDEPVATPTRLVISHGSELAAADLSRVVVLDLALAESDRIGRLAEIDAATVCDAIDLADAAQRAPALRELRISGCPMLLYGIGGFTRVESLALADTSLDALGVAQLAMLGALRRLTLTRVETPEELSLEPLAAIALQHVALADLPRETPLGDALDLWPDSLTSIELAGAWAAHDAMTQVGKARALERLELRDTRVGNFSLNQIKPLSRIRELVWRGDTFNDNSPLYFRDLAVTHFTCDCPRFGDGGLHTLRHNESIETLVLERSAVTGPGLAALERLPALRELVLRDRELGGAGFAALVPITTLRRLDLSGTATPGGLEGIGALRQLEQLRLGYREVDDRVAAELGQLTNLQDLDVSRTRISDAGLVHFGSLTNLRTLLLSRTRITNRGLAALVNAAGLRHLHVDHTDLVDAGVVHIGKLTALETLRIDHTLVTDVAVESLMGLAELQRLDVSDTVISAQGLARLATLPKLVALTSGTTAEPPADE